MCVCMFLCAHRFSSHLGNYVEAQLLDHIYGKT